MSVWQASLVTTAFVEVSHTTMLLSKLPDAAKFFLIQIATQVTPAACCSW